MRWPRAGVNAHLTSPAVETLSRFMGLKFMRSVIPNKPQTCHVWTNVGLSFREYYDVRTPHVIEKTGSVQRVGKRVSAYVCYLFGEAASFCSMT